MSLSLSLQRFILAVFFCIAYTAMAQEPSRLRPDLIGLTDPEPRDELTYTQHCGTAIYEVSIQIGSGDEGETYRGELQCTLEDRQWQVTGTLKEDGPRNPAVFIPDPFMNRSEKQNVNMDYLENIESTISKFTVTSIGEVKSQSDSSPLQLFLGDLVTLPIVRLPNKNQKKWSVEEPTMVGINHRSARLPGMPRLPRGYPIGPFGDQTQVAPAIEKSDYRIGKSDSRMIEILHETSLDASKLSPSCRVSGSGSATFDRHRGVITELAYQREIYINASGAQMTVPVTMNVRLKSDMGLLPLTEKQKQEIADAKAYAESPEGIAEAQQIEQERLEKQAKLEADRVEQQKIHQMKMDEVLLGDSRQSFIDLFNEAQEYGDGTQALGQLRNVSNRIDKPLADAILQFANRIEMGALASQFYDLAAKFDPQFLAVKDLRYQLRHSHSDIADVGDPVGDLAVGQLVMMRSKHSRGYRAFLVVDANQPSTRIRPVDREQPIESILRDQLRLPPTSVVPFLSPTERGESPQSSPDEKPAAASESHPMQTWTDKTGRHQLEARFVSVQNGRVRLQRKDGKLVEIAENSLSEESLAQVEKAIQSESPFELVSP